MATNYAYMFAVINPDTGMCIGYETTSDPSQGELPNYVAIDEWNDGYLFKYYLNGAWYEDAEGTIPWSPDAE